MKRIKIIDAPRYGTDPKVIVKQLSTFIEGFRKKKVALDLIGDDERSAEFNVSDIEIFGEELTYTHTLRITSRANKLAKNRVAAAGVCQL